MKEKIKKYKFTLFLLSILFTWYIFQNYILLYLLGSRYEVLKFFTWTPEKSPLIIFLSSLSNLNFVHFMKNFFSILITGYIIEGSLKEKKYLSLVPFSFLLVIPLFYLSYVVSGERLQLIGTSGVASILIGISLYICGKRVIRRGIHRNIPHLIFLLSALSYFILESGSFVLNSSIQSFIHASAIVTGFFLITIYNQLNK